MGAHRLKRRRPVAVVAITTVATLGLALWALAPSLPSFTSHPSTADRLARAKAEVEATYSGVDLAQLWQRRNDSMLDLPATAHTNVSASQYVGPQQVRVAFEVQGVNAQTQGCVLLIAKGPSPNTLRTWTGPCQPLPFLDSVAP